MLRAKVYVISTTDCHLVGIRRPSSIENINIKNPTAISINNVELVIDMSRLPNKWIGINFIISNCSNGVYAIFFI